MFKTNYHTHSLYCDGNDTVDQMTQEAISKGFKYLGFSSHSIYPFASDWHIAPREHQAYIKDVMEAKAKYKDQISILLGFEADYIPGISKPSLTSDYKDLNPDFLIGSVHYIVTPEGNFTVDESAEGVKRGCEKYFKGDYKTMTREYFRLQRQMLKESDFTIIGHADLIRKNNNILNMFTEKEDWYIEEIKETAKAISHKGVIAEINTGAIARGKMDDVYPSLPFLTMLNELKVPVTINSDCHSRKDLDCAFDRAIDKAYKAGYREICYLDSNREIKFQKIS